MLKVSYQYPGDPVTEATILFGLEFKKRFRPPEGGMIQVMSEDRNGEVHIDRQWFQDVICDTCSNGVADFDPCVLVRDRLYCYECAKPLVTSHWTNRWQIEQTIMESGYDGATILHRPHAATFCTIYCLAAWVGKKSHEIAKREKDAEPAPTPEPPF